MRWFYLLPAAVLFGAFVLGFLAGLGVLLAVPYTRRTLADLALQAQAVAVVRSANDRGRGRPWLGH